MLNIVALMGRLVADPELKTTPQGTSVCSFRIACDRSYVRQGEQRQSDFFTIVAWRQTAEFVHKYFQKGSLIAIDGSIQTRSYTDKNGNNRTAVEVVANNISFAGGKPQTEQPGGAAATPQRNTPGGVEQTSMKIPGQYNAAAGYSSPRDDDFAIIDDNEDLPF